MKVSLEFVYQFQARIYELLTNNQTIRRNVTGVYLSIQQNARYPFILISLIKIDDLSKYGIHTYQIEFEICIFARDKTQEFLLKLASNIISALRPESLNGHDYKVLGIKDNELKFARGQDLLTNKAMIKYEALLQDAL